MRTVLFLLLPFWASGQIYIDSYRFGGAPIADQILDTYTGSAVAYSLRLLDKDYTGNAIMVERASDGDSLGIGFANNYLDTTSLKSFCGTGGTDTCWVRYWYDQSGNAKHLEQTARVNQPQILIGGALNYQDTVVAISFVSDDYLVHNSLALTAGSFSIFSAIKVNSSTTGGFFDAATNVSFGSSTGVRFDRNANNFRFGTNSAFTQSSDTDYTKALRTGIRSSTDRTIWRDGTQLATTSTAGSTSFTGVIRHLVGALNNGTTQTDQVNYLNGHFYELLIWCTDQTSNRSGIETNIATFYGL